MVDPHQFWTNSAYWPSAIPGFVFIAEAMQAIGRARFPKSWTGREPWAANPLPLPRMQRFATNSDVARGYVLSGAVPLMSPSEPGVPPSYVPLDEATWARVAKVAAEQAHAASKASGRWWDVKEMTARLFRIGGMKLFLRPFAGGKPEGPCDPDLWFTEDGRIEPRFAFGLLDLTYGPYSQVEYEPTNNQSDPRYGRQDFRRMYVDRASLAIALDVVARVSPPHLSIRDDDDSAVTSQKPLPAPRRNALPATSEGSAEVAQVVVLMGAGAKKGRGRPKGSTNWDTTSFVAEYVRRLTAYGEPSRQNVPGWLTKSQAAETVLDVFYSGIDGEIDPPSPSAAKAWARGALSQWYANGRPRSEKSGKSEKSRSH